VIIEVTHTMIGVLDFYPTTSLTKSATQIVNLSGSVIHQDGDSIKSLDILFAEMKLSPADEGAECFHKLESSVGFRRIPTSATLSLNSLV
jgi:hypothetical protein